MAEIIKPPKHGKWCIELVCKFKHCKAEFRAFQEDIKVGTFGGSYCEKGDRLPYTTCPSCKSTHKLTWSDVPPGYY